MVDSIVVRPGPTSVPCGRVHSARWGWEGEKVLFFFKRPSGVLVRVGGPPSGPPKGPGRGQGLRVATSEPRTSPPTLTGVPGPSPRTPPTEYDALEALTSSVDRLTVAGPLEGSSHPRERGRDGVPGGAGRRGRDWTLCPRHTHSRQSGHAVSSPRSSAESRVWLWSGDMSGGRPCHLDPSPSRGGGRTEGPVCGRGRVDVPVPVPVRRLGEPTFSRGVSLSGSGVEGTTWGPSKRPVGTGRGPSREVATDGGW